MKCFASIPYHEPIRGQRPQENQYTYPEALHDDPRAYNKNLKNAKILRANEGRERKYFSLLGLYCAALHQGVRVVK